MLIFATSVSFLAWFLFCKQKEERNAKVAKEKKHQPKTNDIKYKEICVEPSLMYVTFYVIPSNFTFHLMQGPILDGGNGRLRKACADIGDRPTMRTRGLKFIHFKIL